MRRLPIRVAAVLACALATTGCAVFGGDDSTAKQATPAAAETADNASQTPYGGLIAKQPGDLDGEIRQAQLMRAQGDYAGAVRALAQLMLVAPDDPRVVGEYGKVLAQQDRSQDALAFLKRAVQLQPDNWTLYSALGVTYDQLDQREKAEGAYKHALLLHPNEPTVLNNYAVSQMLAGHLDRAEDLLHQAAAHGGDYPKIANNLAMINQMRGERAGAGGPESAVQPATAVAQADPRPHSAVIKPAPSAHHVMAAVPMASVPGRPRALTNKGPIAAKEPIIATRLTKLPHKAKPAKAEHRVVMEKVPYDPLAGKVYGKGAKDAPKFAKAMPKPRAERMAKADSKAETKPAAPVLRTAADLY